MTDNTAMRPWDLFARAVAETGALHPALRAQTEELCRIQAALCDHASAMAEAWLSRRRESAAATQTAALAMCDAASPMDAGRAWQQWLSGSLERLVADGVDAQARVAGMAQLMLGAMPHTMPSAPQAEPAPATIPAERRAA